jgi:hypothetical protein
LTLEFEDSRSDPKSSNSSVKLASDIPAIDLEYYKSRHTGNKSVGVKFLCWMDEMYACI